MVEFVKINEADLIAFSEMSQVVGRRADYVQGGGGNTSVKLANGLMAIKASGYCLRDIQPDKAYAVLEGRALRRFFQEHNPEDFEDVEKSGAAQVKASSIVVDGIDKLRPSVEAGFHSLLDKFVLHTHPVYANFATCCEDCEGIVRKALVDADYTYGIVPYADPGSKLTFFVRDELARCEHENGKRPEVLFMKNHGLIVHGPNAADSLRIQDDVNNRLASAFGKEFPSLPPCKVENGVMDCPYLVERLQSGKYGEDFFLKEALYPDQIVFLLGTLMFGSQAPGTDQCVVDLDKGRLSFNMSDARAQVVVETMLCEVFVVETIQSAGLKLAYMGEAGKQFIANWESERYRRSLSGRK